MTQGVHFSRMKYLFSYILAMTSAVLTFETFYLFEADATFGIQMIGLNFGLLIFLWFLSFIHTDFIRQNIFMVLVLPLTGLHVTNLMPMLMSPGTSSIGYLSFVIASSLLIFISYKTRRYEKQIQKSSGIF